MDEEKISVGLEIKTDNAEEKVDGVVDVLLNVVKAVGTLGDRISDKLNKAFNIQRLDISEFKEKYKSEIDSLSDISKRLGESITKEFPKEGYKIIADGEDIKVEEIKNDTEEASDNAEKLDKNINKTRKSAGLLSTIFARISKQLSRQIFYSIASLLNPINNIRRVFDYMTTVLDKRLGSTFSNIKDNLLEYVATSTLFQKIIEWTLSLVYTLQVAYNWVAKIFSWRQIDLFKPSVKSIQKAEKSAKNMTASFDEINNIGNQGEDTSPYSIGELNKFGEITTLGDKLKKKLDEIKLKFKELSLDDAWQMIKDNWWKVLLVFVGIAAVLKIIKGGFGNVAEPINGLVNALSGGVILLGLALVLQSITDLFKVMLSSGQDLGVMILELGIVLAIVLVAMSGIVAIGNAAQGAIAGIAVVVLSVVVVLMAVAEFLPIILYYVDRFIQDVFPILKDLIVGIIDVIGQLILIIGVTLVDVIGAIGALVETIGETIVNTIDGIFNSIITFITRLGPAINTLVDNIIDSAKKIFNFITKGFETIVNNGVTAINWLLKPLRNLGNDVLELIGVKNFKFNEISKLSGLTYLDVGTNYVPNDQLAMIHQGEAVIPKKFNEREFFGGDNEETNDLIVQILDAINDIDFSPRIGVDDIGKASVNYINRENRITGRRIV